MRTTVVTAALPSRGALLADAVSSVAAQRTPPVAHLVGIDYDRKGSAAVRNKLAYAADTLWLSFLDDDDVLYPQHLEVHAAHAHDADLIYSYCHVFGRDWNPNEPFDADTLRQRNYIPATVTIRTALFRDVGGFRPSAECEHGWEDWDLWRGLLDAGCRFVCVPEVTWMYRFHGGNKTYRGEKGAV